jgi:hypothetical protein
VELFDIIRSAGGGEIVRILAAEAGLGPKEAEQALRELLPELGRAIRRAGESRSGAAAVHTAMHDERYARYLEDPAALREAAAVADGERVLLEVLEDHERSELVRRVAAAIGPDEGHVRKLLPLIASLAMAALGQRLREPSPEATPSSRSPEIPWFGTHPQDRFDEPLVNALAHLFGSDEEQSPKDR